MTAAATSSTPDFAGIALLVSAISTLIGTVGGLIVMLRRSNNRAITRAEAEEVARAIREQSHLGDLDDAAP
jgi:hypothetical protein